MAVILSSLACIRLFLVPVVSIFVVHEMTSDNIEAYQCTSTQFEMSTVFI